MLGNIISLEHGSLCRASRAKEGTDRMLFKQTYLMGIQGYSWHISWHIR